MTYLTTKKNYPFLMSLFLTVSLLALPLMVGGCAGTHQTTKETTVSTSSEAAPVETVETNTTTTQSSTETRPSSPGVIGSAFHFIGTVLAFPFKVIGGALEAIF